MLLSVSNFIIIIFEIYYYQVMSTGDGFFLVNRSKLGYEIINQDKKKKASNQDPQEESLVTIEAPKREKARNRQRYYIHESLTKFRVVGCFQIITFLFFLLISLFAFSLADCGTNTFDTGQGVCKDCLNGLGITCAECSSQDVCDNCKKGYMPAKNAVDWTICASCSIKHGEQCGECDADVCLGC